MTMNPRHPLPPNRVIRHQGEVAALGDGRDGLGDGYSGQAGGRHKRGG